MTSDTQVMNITCIGGGVMASAFAVAQSAKHCVRIVPSRYDAQTVTQIQATNRDERLDCQWPKNIAFSTELVASDLIVIGVSAAGLDWALEIARELLVLRSCPVLLLTKGLVPTKNGLTPLSVYLSQMLNTPAFAITGPCIAKDLAHGMPTEVEISGEDYHLAQSLSLLLGTPFYTIHANRDYIGCQWAAALKNVYAIRVGMANGLNARSAYYAEALAEMAGFVERNGGQYKTVMGLSGAGDLYVTSLGGRNGKFGGYLGRGMSAQAIFDGPMKAVTVEGYELAELLFPHTEKVSEPIFCSIIESFE